MNTALTFSEKKLQLIELIKISDISEEEKNSWLVLVNDMLEHEVDSFARIMQKEAEAKRASRAKFQEKMRQVKDDFGRIWQEFLKKSHLKIEQTKKNQIYQDEQTELKKLRDQINQIKQ